MISILFLVLCLGGFCDFVTSDDVWEKIQQSETMMPPSLIQPLESDEIPPPPTQENSYTADPKTNINAARSNICFDGAQRIIIESFETLNNVLKRKKIEEDECDVYGKLLAMKLRKYPEGMRDRIMYEIDGLLLGNRPDERSTNSSSNYSSQSTSSPHDMETRPLQSSCSNGNVGCNEYYMPDNCDFSEISPLTVEDYERCGPATLNLTARNFFQNAAGRGVAKRENRAGFDRLRIIPKMFNDISENSLNVETLGQEIAFPIGLSPVAFQRLANPEGEKVTARAISDLGTVMILSAYATTTLEEVAEIAEGGSSHLWMQIYIFNNRSFTEMLVKNAERAGYKAIVVTLDLKVSSTPVCNVDLGELQFVNLPGLDSSIDQSLTCKDLNWLRSITDLPIIAKGIMSVSEAEKAVFAGMSGIIVSNHGGRQMDNTPGTIDVLPGIVDAVNELDPSVEIYVDGGIKNGWDVYKAIASGAKMAFIGRPYIWGLAKEGESGVRNVVDILRSEFQEAMLLSGASNPSELTRDFLVRD